jgi:hypothetical protein
VPAVALSAHADEGAITGPTSGHARSAAWTPAAVAIMIVGVGISPGTEHLARAMFGPEEVKDALEITSWYDDVQPDDVHRAVLTLSKGNLDALLNLVAAAVRDFRDVLLWESLPEPTPEELAATRARVDDLIRERRQARHRYLVARFGVQGAEQVERSNENLFGRPQPQVQGDGTDAG